MKVKQKRVLKNGAVAGYVYYPKDKKWKWRIIGRQNNKKKGGGKNNIASLKTVAGKNKIPRNIMGSLGSMLGLNTRNRQIDPNMLKLRVEVAGSGEVLIRSLEINKNTPLKEVYKIIENKLGNKFHEFALFKNHQGAKLNRNTKKIGNFMGNNNLITLIPNLETFTIGNYSDTVPLSKLRNAISDKIESIKHNVETDINKYNIKGWKKDILYNLEDEYDTETGDYYYTREFEIKFTKDNKSISIDILAETRFSSFNLTRFEIESSGISNNEESN